MSETFIPPGACFLTHAAHGRDLARELDRVRQFRDRVLRPSRLGRRLADFYYRASPSLAALVQRHRSCNALSAAALFLLAALVRD